MFPGSQSESLWSYEKPGFSNNQYISFSNAKPNPDGSLSGIRAYLENDVTDKKAIVLNKLNFQNETSVSADMNFNHFFNINLAPGSEPTRVTKGFYRFTNADFT